MANAIRVFYDASFWWRKSATRTHSQIQSHIRIRPQPLTPQKQWLIEPSPDWDDADVDSGDACDSVCAPKWTEQ